MNFDLTDDQGSIQRTARDFLASAYPPAEVRRLAYETERGFTDEGWAAMCELGWPALLVPEEHGGLGLGVVELAVLQEQLAYALAPTPLLSTVAAALQVHGGIGFTWEHDLHLFLKRAEANAHAYGDSRWHREQVAAALL